MANEAIAHLGDFLAHPYPRVSDQIPRVFSTQLIALPVPKQIRGDTAEYLYLLLQGTDALEIDDEAESVLLETEWCVGVEMLFIAFLIGLLSRSSENTEIAKAASLKLVESLVVSLS